MLTSMRVCPKLVGHCDGVNLSVLPPGGFVTASVDFAVMAAAQRNCEFIADLTSKRTALCEPEMVSIRRSAPADETWLSGNKLHMVFVAKPSRFRDCEHVFVD
jgi:hypothetical protein